MAFKKGDRVVHPSREAWGIGEVLENSNGTSVRVFFVHGGEKKLVLKYAPLVKLDGEQAQHAALDNLALGRLGDAISFQSLPDSIEGFLELFPGGFHGEKFSEHEREYKAQAHAQARELLDKQAASALLEAGDHAELTRRALQLVNATNLIYPNEKMALRDGLKDEGAQQEFAEALFFLLHGESDFKDRFRGFCAQLENIDAAKWTIATYFPFFVHPDRHMFVKPTVTQHAATMCRFEINYKPELNWLTYKSVLAFSDYLFEATSALEPRDMIDVQSFMWCIAPGKYRGS